MVRGGGPKTAGGAPVSQNRDVRGTIVGCAGNGWAGRFCLHPDFEGREGRKDLPLYPRVLLRSSRVDLAIGLRLALLRNHPRFQKPLCSESSRATSLSWRALERRH